MKLIRILLFPVAILYDLVTRIRNMFYEIGWFSSTKFDLPIIVVGNLSVGGTGKTPQIEYLIQLLQHHYRVAVLSRGYGRKTSGFMKATDSSTSKDIGDEPLQFFKKFKKITVVVDENRVRGIKLMLAYNTAPEVILLDDAFQHRKVNAGFYILLTKYDDLFVDDFLLPTGNLRESRRGVKRANVIIVTKCPESLSINEQKYLQERLSSYQKPVFFTKINYSENIKSNNNKSLTLGELREKNILLITGIANPTPLTMFLSDNNCVHKHISFPDHHDFSTDDIRKINLEFEKINSNNKILLTTEKDFVRLEKNIKSIYYIEIESQFLFNQTPIFNNLIEDFVKNH